VPIITQTKSQIPEPITGQTIEKRVIPTREIMDVNKIENLFLPYNLERSCYNAYRIYNLFEKMLPTTGHIAVLVATALASMCVTMDRQFNLGIGALVGQGKTTILKQFCTIPFVNYISRTTYADYMLMYCGKFLKSKGRKLPYGVRYDKRARWDNGGNLDTSEAQDCITNRFDIITDGETIFRQSESSLKQFLQFLQSIIEQGWYRGGDQYSGHYVIGDPTHRVKHGVILACTLTDFEKQVLTDIGWNSRSVLVVWRNTESENNYVRYGVRHNFVADEPEFFFEVKNLLQHLSPSNIVEIDYENDEVADKIEETENMLKNIRLEVPGIRATKDVKRILKAFAWLNFDNKIRYEHVLFVKALISSLCRRLRVDSERSSFYKDLGSRLHFQVSLLQNLDYSKEEIKKFILKTFPFWNKNKSVYTEEEIEQAITDVNQPITGFIKKKQGLLA